jgi:lipid-binding SYLF domain-containing protein
MKLTHLKRIGISCLSAAVLSGGLLYAGESATTRLKTSAEVLTEIMATPDKGIPQELLENSHCIVIVPGMKKGALLPALAGPYCSNAGNIMSNSDQPPEQ